MKKEHYEFITQYANNMQTAATVGYSRNIPRKEIKKIVEVYKEETGKEYNGNPYCAGCLVSLLVEIKELYDAHNHPDGESRLGGDNPPIGDRHLAEDNPSTEESCLGVGNPSTGESHSIGDNPPTEDNPSTGKSYLAGNNPSTGENILTEENHSTKDSNGYKEKSEDNKVRRLRKEKNDTGLDK